MYQAREPPSFHNSKLSNPSLKRFLTKTSQVWAYSGYKISWLPYHFSLNEKYFVICTPFSWPFLSFSFSEWMRYCNQYPFFKKSSPVVSFQGRDKFSHYPVNSTLKVLLSIFTSHSKTYSEDVDFRRELNEYSPARVFVVVESEMTGL